MSSPANRAPRSDEPTREPPLYNFVPGLDAETASNCHAHSAVEAGLFGAEVVATLHAELADAYARIADLELGQGVDWFGIVTELAPNARFSDLERVAAKRGLMIDMLPTRDSLHD